MICRRSSRCASSTFTKAFFIVLFCLSTRPFDCGWYAEAIRCSTPVRSCKQVHNTINKFSFLIIYLDCEATMTTHKPIKKRSDRQSCLISDWYDLRPFSEIINADGKIAVAIHLREKTKI